MKPVFQKLKASIRNNEILMLIRARKDKNPGESIAVKKDKLPEI